MVIGTSIFYLYVDLPAIDSRSMKKVSILLLILLSANVYPQAKTDSLLSRLDSLAGKERIEILKELCWENRFSPSRNTISLCSTC